MKKKTTVRTFQEMRAAGEPIVMVTAYDTPQAQAVDAAGVDAVLVGDSLAMTVLGRGDTLGVTLDEMVHHTRAVSRGVKNAMVIADMPFMSCQVSPRETLQNAARLIQKGGAQAVKIEWSVDTLAATRLLVGNGIPVMGHLGLTPQHVNCFGGYRIQGKDRRSAARMIQRAKALEKAGVFSIVLELVPPPLARKITRSVRVPTIGIGAGPLCSGQVQVLHDLAGMCPGFRPKHAKVYANLFRALRSATSRYVSDVRNRRFAP